MTWSGSRTFTGERNQGFDHRKSGPHEHGFTVAGGEGLGIIHRCPRTQKNNPATLPPSLEAATAPRTAIDIPIPQNRDGAVHRTHDRRGVGSTEDGNAQ